MKAIFIKYTLVLSFLFVWGACSEDGEVRDLGVTSVQTFYEPVNGKTFVLQPSASASLYFEWEPARAEDNGAVLYEVAFDKADGDFSTPLYTTASDNNGGDNHATLTHKQLNQIAELAGVNAGEEGTLKWTVYSSKGIQPVKAEEERRLVITRLAGLTDMSAPLNAPVGYTSHLVIK